MVVEGYATTFNEPYTLGHFDNITIREQVDPDAFAEADMSDVIFQYNHEGRVFARTRNNTLTVTPDERGLFIHADLSGTEEGRKLYAEIRDGYTDRMSFGFTVAEDAETVTRNEETGETDYLRTITRIGKLYDVSAVSIPANDGTEISARSYCDGVIASEREENLKREQREAARKRLALKLRLMEV